MTTRLLQFTDPHLYGAAEGKLRGVVTYPALLAALEHARARGMVPNLTTSGLYSDAELARLCGWAKLFGQINVSLDGVGDDYARVRGFDGFARADQAIVALRKATKHIGINCVVTRQNFDGLGAVFAVIKTKDAPDEPDPM